MTRPTAPYPAEPTHGQHIIDNERRRASEHDPRTFGEWAFLAAMVTLAGGCIIALATNGVFA